MIVVYCKQVLQSFNDIDEDIGGTGKIRLCQVKTYHSDLAVTSLCMAVLTHRLVCPNKKLKVVNEIHSLLMTMTHMTQVTVCEGLDRGLRLN